MSKLVNCKDCNKEISKKAKTCPHCGAKRKKNRLLRFIIGLVVIVIAAVIIGQTGSDSANEETVYYAIGDIIVTKNFETTITKVEFKKQVGSFWSTTASEGGKYLCIQYKYKNISDEPIGTFNTPTIGIIDSNGVKYSSDSTAATGYSEDVGSDENVLNKVNPGITIKAVTAFELSEDTINSNDNPLYIEIDVLRNGFVNIK